MPCDENPMVYICKNDRDCSFSLQFVLSPYVLQVFWPFYFVCLKVSRKRGSTHSEVADKNCSENSVTGYSKLKAQKKFKQRQDVLPMLNFYTVSLTVF